jgi:hypothetical protein
MVYYREGGSEKHLRGITGILRIRGNLLEIWEAILKRLEQP